MSAWAETAILTVGPQAAQSPRRSKSSCLLAPLEDSVAQAWAPAAVAVARESNPRLCHWGKSKRNRDMGMLASPLLPLPSVRDSLCSWCGSCSRGFWWKCASAAVDMRGLVSCPSSCCPRSMAMQTLLLAAAPLPVALPLFVSCSPFWADCIGGRCRDEGWGLCFWSFWENVGSPLTGSAPLCEGRLALLGTAAFKPKSA